ncbi:MULTISPECIES: CBS domain-containing protein [unclassified Rhodococcus (in: high G+C Gram-positive bacteria)]|uniref:CBS domain-containing protein n=1 Tax=unclassified Rhodococcus (in: high G+C Gram-positive bacteria) TaxID=192944 RepID=UPI0014471EB3|nr:MULTISPECIES: CBS domain-containing protein [unclassified Rhodococcus (in: high G+C Gram-positive bacteria)]
MTREVVTAQRDTPVREAIMLLTSKRFAALPVVDRKGALVGIVSESDLLAFQTSNPKAVISPAVVSEVETAEPQWEASTAAAVMLDRHVRSMPVVESGILVGVIARSDVLRSLIIGDNEVIAAKVRALLDDYSGSTRRWVITVRSGGVVEIGGRFDDDTERHVVRRLLSTIDGVTEVNLDTRISD